MRNFVKTGDKLTLTAPYARTAGQGALVGAIFGVACSDVENAALGEFQTAGVFTLTKVGSQAWAVGDKIYWDNGNKRCTTDATAGMLIGVATAVVASGAGDTTGNVRLNGVAPDTLEGPQAAEADIVDNGGGATADGTIGAVTTPTALTFGTNITSATANGALVDSSSSAPTETEFNELAKELGTRCNDLGTLVGVVKDNIKELTTRQGENRAAIVALTDAVKELSTKQNALLAKLRLAGIIATS